MPTRRQSIHRDEKDSGESHKEVLQFCDTCFKYFLIQRGETLTKLDDASLKRWLELEKKKTGVTPNLEEAATFKCNNCVEETIECSAAKYAPSRSWFKNNIVWIVLVIVLLGVAIKVQEMISNTEKSFDVNLSELTTEEQILEDELYNLNKIYYRQEEKVWIKLVSGIKSILKKKPNQPSVFLMLYDSDSAGKTAKCIAQDVSKSATKFLMKKSKTPVMFSGEQLRTHRFLNDPGLLLVDYNATVRESGSLVVTNLQDVPPEVATSFHFFCDSYSPLVEKAVYFFTLKMNELPSSKVQAAAENRLRELWSEKLTDHKLQPLITRMTSYVLKISSDSSDC